MNVIPVKGHVLFKPIKKIIYSQNRIPLRKILLYSFYNIYVLVNAHHPRITHSDTATTITLAIEQGV